MRRLLRTPGVGEPRDEGVWSNAGVPVDKSSFQEASSRRTRTTFSGTNYFFGGVLFSIRQHGINEICKTNLPIFGIYKDLLGDLLAFQTFATRTYLKYSPEI